MPDQVRGVTMFREDVGGALLDAARRHADRPALWAVGRRLTYADLMDAAASVAATLEAGGVRTGDRVAVLCRRTPTAYAAILGALLAGCAYTPLNAQFARGRNQAILTASDAVALVLDAPCASQLDRFLDPLDPDLLVVQPEAEPQDVGGRRADAVAGQGPEFWASVRRPVPRDGLAYLLFTSGSTGTPKGVPISHANLSAYLAGIQSIEPTRSDDRVLQHADLTFDISVHDLFATWLNGAELYSVPENAGILAARMIPQHGITSYFIVPSTSGRALEQGLAKPGSLPSLRVTYYCGEPLPRSVASGWKRAAPNGRVINLYGPTEATVAISSYEYRPEEAEDLAVLPIGVPFRAGEMALFTPEGRRAGAGETGELCLSGPQVMEGYWQNPALNAEKLFAADGRPWYRTGDLGRWVEPHGFVFAGRVDRQVRLRGQLVELQDMEGAVRRVTGRQSVAVIPWPVTDTGRVDGTVAFVGGNETDVAELRAGCRALAGDYLVPDRVLFLPELPVNANGKVDYKALVQHPGLGAAGEAARKA